MAQIQRVLPPWYAGDLAGPHIFGDQVVEFDADGLADVTDPAVLEVMQAFPETFHVVDPPPAPRRRTAESQERAENVPTGHGQHDLEQLTVYELQDLAARLRISGARTMRKQELIDAILAAQAPAQEG